jgi:hypothetical protein
MRYMLVIAGEEGGMDDATPEDMKAVMAAWDKFTQETVDSGAFIAGEGLQPSSTATTVQISADGGEPTVTDGPFAESKEQVGGFYLLECKDLDEALDWAKKIPARGGFVEVRPVMDYEASGVASPQERQAAHS